MSTPRRFGVHITRWPTGAEAFYGLVIVGGFFDGYRVARDNFAPLGWPVWAVFACGTFVGIATAWLYWWYLAPREDR